MKVTYTHKGWLYGLAPVYLGDIESLAPHVEPRRWVPGWWLDLCEDLFAAFVFLVMLVNPAFEPEFPILITGKLPEPLVIDHEEDAS